MQLGKSLLGAIAGVAVGIVLLLVVYLTLGLDKVWLSIPFAFVTGLGVRMFATTSGHASYVRGALTMLLALAGYIGGWCLVAEVASARANAPSNKPPAATAANPPSNEPPAAATEEKPAAEPGDAATTDAEVKDEAKDETKDTDAAPKVVPAEKPVVAVRDSESAMMPRGAFPKAMAYTPIEVICLAIAALVAYEMGRGSGIAARPA